jgi:putative glutathione S-transferase
VGRLIDSKWTDNDESYRQAGAFVRPTPAFRSFITADGSSQFPAEAARYHLYVALPCPYAATAEEP